MKILFLHGWQSVPGGVKPTFLKDHGHEVINPALPHEDFIEAVRISDLNKALVGLFPSNTQERQVVLEILGYAGILNPKGWPSFFDAWVPPSEREEPGHFYKKEWQFPASGWTGKDGINEVAVRFWFPQIE